MNITEIQDRLNKASKGPWIATRGGSTVNSPLESRPNEPYYTSAEDDCILDFEQKEIIGCSEWMRVKWDDLKFMAHARQDIEDLLAEVQRLKMKIQETK